MQILSSNSIVHPYATRLPQPHVRFTKEIRAVIAFLIVLAFYVTQVQGAIEQEYAIRAAERRITSLKNERRQLSTDLSELRAIRRLNAFARSRGFTEVGAETAYLPLYPPQVVQTAPNHGTP